MKFSERIGLSKPKIEIQKDDMDKELRNGLWNVYSKFIFNEGLLKFGNNMYTSMDFPKVIDNYFISLWSTHFKLAIDTLLVGNKLYNKIRSIFMDDSYEKVYDVIEYTTKYFKDEPFNRILNAILERELSAYRIINNILTPVIDEIQVKTIESIKDMDDKFKSIKIHLVDAHKKLSDRKNPDYRNSIKESISAVEALCKLILKDQKVELGDALKKIENKYKLHKALKAGFSSLYGYTSDENGIRHAIFDVTDIEFEDALFFLISCTAFVSYLIQKCEKKGIAL